MLNYTLDLYERQYPSEAADILWKALLDHHARAANPTAAKAKPLPPDLAPLPPDEVERSHDQRIALLGCIVAMYQDLSDAFHTAIGIELAMNKECRLPPKPTHAAIVRDMGRQVQQLVRKAVGKNAWQIMNYCRLPNVFKEAGQENSAQTESRFPQPHLVKLHSQRLTESFSSDCPLQPWRNATDCRACERRWINT